MRTGVSPRAVSGRSAGRARTSRGWCGSRGLPGPCARLGWLRGPVGRPARPASGSDRCHALVHRMRRPSTHGPACGSGRRGDGGCWPRPSSGRGWRASTRPSSTSRSRRSGGTSHTDFASLQWTITAYTLTLASLILLGGALGDRYGRRRVFVIGVVWFAVASLLCGARADGAAAHRRPRPAGSRRRAAHPGQPRDDPGDVRAAGPGPRDRRVVGARRGRDRGGAVRGRLADPGGLLAVGLPHQRCRSPSSSCWSPGGTSRRRGTAPSRGTFDALGAVLGALGLAGVTYAIIEAPVRGPGAPVVVAAALVGLASMVGFVVVESARAAPDAAARDLLLGPVHRRERRHVHRLRRASAGCSSCSWCSCRWWPGSPRSPPVRRCCRSPSSCCCCPPAPGSWRSGSGHGCR